MRVWEVERQIQAQRETNQKLKARNAALDAEVRDLKRGLDAIEERARSELGMIREDEVFFHVLEGPGPQVLLRSPLPAPDSETGLRR